MDKRKAKAIRRKTNHVALHVQEIIEDIREDQKPISEGAVKAENLVEIAQALLGKIYEFVSEDRRGE